MLYLLQIPWADNMNCETKRKNMLAAVNKFEDNARTTGRDEDIGLSMSHPLNGKRYTKLFPYLSLEIIYPGPSTCGTQPGISGARPGIQILKVTLFNSISQSRQQPLLAKNSQL